MMRFVIQASIVSPLVAEFKHFMRYFDCLFMIIKLIFTWIVRIHRLPHGHLHLYWHLHLHVLIGLIIAVIKLKGSPPLPL